jgi:GAF domain-containing protein
MYVSVGMTEPTFDAVDEIERQRAVDRSGALHGRGAADLQRVVDRAADMYRVPMATISIIDRARQWFAARHGIDRSEMPRSVSFCAHAIHRPGEPMIVMDAASDPRFAANPLVTGTPGIRFYAGVPLIDRMGYALGALCIADVAPRQACPDLIDLRFLAHEAERLLAA